jgi:hypothetical protein
MCILTSGGDRGGSPQATAQWYRQQQRKGGWLFGPDALDHVVGSAFAGVLRALRRPRALPAAVAGWASFLTHPARHPESCRYRRACARIGWT